VPFLYDNGSRRDGLHQALVRRVEGLGGAVRAVEGLDDAALARRVEQDRIDVLVDLSGHTGRSRLAAFARRPAPVQISWLGYFATTGLTAIDFVLLDPHHAPPGAQAQFTERIVRLPHNRFCYAAPAFAPPVAPSPCSATGVITFGSFNNTAKLNAPVLDAWARILEQVPGSRLVLKWRTFADAAYRERVRAVFAQRRVDPARLELRPMSGHRELLHEYADIDIALDPFPFSGGQTSCEALWMGVPVVTLPQERVVSRQTYSFLANIGLTELAAADPQDYVRIAASLAADPARLGSLRACLRPRMAASPLCDAPGFVRALEGAYRLAWDTVRREGAPGRGD
jgi:predicted O-linked N-acetylglucosamine transferase (SPINDLY family)